MTADDPNDALSEEAREGLALLARVVRPVLTPEDDGKFIALDLDSHEYEVDPGDYTATHRLRLRCPRARVWLFRAGDDATYALRRATVGGWR
jgi:hypothetical protein